jgi:flagellar biosynthesis/type III secretory pathway protein FliH
MAKMKIAPKDRPKVRVECLRLLATLKLDPARSKLIGGFIETYLQLSAEEMKQYEREFAKLTPEEQEATMELMTSWERKGKEEGRQEGRIEGRQEGKEELVVQQIQRRLGAISPPVLERLNRLSAEQLNELGVALLDFKTLAELENWLSRYIPQ